jgi:uncharacterized protein YkwD
MVEFRHVARAAVSVIALAMALVSPAMAGASVSRLGEDGSLASVSTEAVAEQSFRTLINEERAADGLEPLAVYGDLVDDARLQANAIADAGYLFHNPDLTGVTTGWFTLGENVGYGPTVEMLHEAFMASPHHRDNVMLARYNYVGVGVVIDESDVIWVAVVFMYGPDGLADVVEADPFDPPFSDDEGSVHELSIAAIAEAGITSGCDDTGEHFCPGESVSRAQMATFLMRAFDLPATDIDYFDDDNGSVHEAAINAMAAAGITSGCGERQYCGGDEIKRAHMATFLMRAAHMEPSHVDQFGDDDGSPHEGAINALAGAGISGGCAEGEFCPGDPVSRGQMATFLARALDLIGS